MSGYPVVFPMSTSLRTGSEMQEREDPVSFSGLDGEWDERSTTASWNEP